MTKLADLGISLPNDLPAKALQKTAKEILTTLTLELRETLDIQPWTAAEIVQSVSIAVAPELKSVHQLLGDTKNRYVKTDIKEFDLYAHGLLTRAITEIAGASGLFLVYNPVEY